jgi:hypothetical protein
MRHIKCHQVEPRHLSHVWITGASRSAGERKQVEPRHLSHVWITGASRSAGERKNELNDCGRETRTRAPLRRGFSFGRIGQKERRASGAAFLSHLTSGRGMVELLALII